jgi:hypothetical protein
MAMTYEEQMQRLITEMAEGQPVTVRQEDLAEIRPMWEALSPEEQRDITEATPTQLDAICNGESFPDASGTRLLYTSLDGTNTVASTTIAASEFLDELFGYLGIKA